MRVFCEFRKLLSLKIPFLTNVFKYIWPHLDENSLCIDYSVESYEITVIVAISLGSLKRLKLPKPRYAPSHFSLIRSLFLKDLSYILCAD